MSLMNSDAQIRRIYERWHVCVARTWPVPVATLFNGEPVDVAGGGRVVKTRTA
jgi:hypothetical protein